MLRIRGVSKSYGQSMVVQALDLDLEPGLVHCLVGPNAAGKSTLLEMAGRLRKPDSGQVSLNGQPLELWPARQLSREMAIMTQGLDHVPDIPLQDFVGLGRFPWNQGRPHPDDRLIVQKVLAFLDLQSIGHQSLTTLSGGQRQRAVLGLCLAQDTPWLLLDEPLNNLDPRHGVAMMRLLQDLVRNQGKTVVTVIHDLNLAAMYSDRLHCLVAGNLVFSGQPGDFMETGNLDRYFGLEASLVPYKERTLCLYY